MFELLDSQRLMYYGDKKGVGQACLLCGSMLLPQKASLDDLQKAANEVFRINAGLRTRFIEKDGKVYQEYKAFSERKIEIKHFDSKDSLDKWARVYATIPLKLDIRTEGKGLPKSLWKTAKPSTKLIINIVRHKIGMFFIRLKYGMLKRKPACCEIILLDLPDSSGAIVKMHHVISDAWSMVLVANQFLQIMNGEAPQAYDFKEHIENEVAYVQRKSYYKDKEFVDAWLNKCTQKTWVWSYPYTSLSASRRTVALDKKISTQIRQYADAHSLTPYTIFLSATCIYMWRKMNKDTFFVGSVLLNRTGFREKNTVGMFVKATPLLVEINENDSFSEVLSKIRDISFSGLRHHRGYTIPLDKRNSLYDVWVSYQNAVFEAGLSAEFTQYYCNYVVDTTILSIEDRSGAGYYNLHFDHNCKVPESDVDELFQTVLTVLYDGLDNDTRKVKELGV